MIIATQTMRRVSKGAEDSQREFDAASALTDAIRADLRTAARAFLAAGEKLQVAHRSQAWQALSRSSWQEWCELDLHISDSLANDLIRLHRLSLQVPHETQRLLKVGVSKARLMLPHIREDTPPERVAEMLDDLETLSWRDARARLGGEEQITNSPSPTIAVACPRCETSLEIALSRAATVLRVKIKGRK